MRNPVNAAIHVSRANERAAGLGATGAAKLFKTTTKTV